MAPSNATPLSVSAYLVSGTQHPSSSNSTGHLELLIVLGVLITIFTVSLVVTAATHIARRRSAACTSPGKSIRDAEKQIVPGSVISSTLFEIDNPAPSLKHTQAELDGIKVEREAKRQSYYKSSQPPRGSQVKQLMLPLHVNGRASHHGLSPTRPGSIPRSKWSKRQALPYRTSSSSSSIGSNESSFAESTSTPPTTPGATSTTDFDDSLDRSGTKVETITYFPPGNERGNMDEQRIGKNISARTDVMVESQSNCLFVEHEPTFPGHFEAGSDYETRFESEANDVTRPESLADMPDRKPAGIAGTVPSRAASELFDDSGDQSRSWFDAIVDSIDADTSRPIPVNDVTTYIISKTSMPVEKRTQLSFRTLPRSKRPSRVISRRKRSSSGDSPARKLYKAITDYFSPPCKQSLSIRRRKVITDVKSRHSRAMKTPSRFLFAGVIENYNNLRKMSTKLPKWEKTAALSSKMLQSERRTDFLSVRKEKAALGNITNVHHGLISACDGDLLVVDSPGFGVLDQLLEQLHGNIRRQHTEWLRNPESGLKWSRTPTRTSF